MGAVTSSPGDVALALLTGGIGTAIKGGSQEKDVGSALTRGALSILTAGTSEIQTGGGAYGDETVADILFPKQINDLALQGRQAARTAKDKAAAAEKAAFDAEKPPPPMDFTDEKLQAARRSSLLRLATNRGRAASFLTGPMGDTSTLSLGRPTALGG